MNMRKTEKKWGAGLLAALLSLGLLWNPPAAEAAAEPQSSGSYTRNGTFHIDQFGEYDIHAEVTVTEGTITGLQVTGDHFGGTYGEVNRGKLSQAAEGMTAGIVGLSDEDAEGIQNVDVVSGATYSSNGIKAAVRDALDLEANPRSSKTGSVTSDIQESIETDPMIFPFKTKGILLAASQYERLERNRYKITPENRSFEGILDGGHNTLAIGLYILQRAMEARGLAFPRGQKTWDEFKTLWRQNTDSVHAYLEALKKETNDRTLDFYIPAELLVPRDPEDLACVEAFRRELLEICAARNNNVQLPVSDKANQMGYFEDLKELLDARNPAVSDRVAWKTNDGGDIKAQDIVALAWIPLNLITPVRDGNGRTLEPVLAQNIYRNKGGCLKQFEKLMSSPEVTSESGEGYKHQLKNSEVKSAFQIAAELPELYDYIYEMFPALYNAAGGLYGRITAVKTLNEKRRDLRTPFGGKVIETVSPDGYIMPLVYGLQALMENRIVRGRHEICWNRPPMEFLYRNLGKIVQSYAGIFSMCDYDPQKIGKNPQSYAQALSGFKMAMAGIL